MEGWRNRVLASAFGIDLHLGNFGMSSEITLEMELTKRSFSMLSVDPNIVRTGSHQRGIVRRKHEKSKFGKLISKFGKLNSKFGK